VSVESVEKTSARGGVSASGGAENLRKTVQKAAAKKAVRTAGEKGQSSGITVRFAGKEVPGVRIATAAVGRGVGRVTPKPVKRAGGVTKRAAGAVRPQITPEGMTKAEHVLNRQTERRARATRGRGLREAEAQLEGHRGKLTPEEWAQVQHAVETRRIGKLPEKLREPAIVQRSVSRAALKERRRAGEPLGDVTGVRKPARETVPEVTADPSTTRKLVSKEQRREAKIEKILRESRAQERVAQGRSEILSRNVSGRRGEDAAIRAGNERARAEGRRAAGGVGVADAQKAIRIAERRLAAARGRVDAATSRHEREVALEAQQKAERKVVEARVAVARTAPKEYMPHMRQSVIDGTAEQTARTGVRSIGSAKEREIHLPVREANKRLGPDEQFSTDVPLVQANYRVQTANAVAGANMVREIASRAGKVVPGKTKEIPAGHAVYRLHGSRLDPVDDAELAHLEQVTGTAKGLGKVKGQLIHLNEKQVENFQKQFVDTRTEFGKGFDFVQGKWKRAATFTPGFHIRNMIGDTQMAYLAQPGHRLPVNAAVAGRALKRMTNREATLRKTGVKAAPSEKTIKVAGKDTKIDEFLDDAINEGVIRSGMVSRDIGGTAAEGRISKAELDPTVPASEQVSSGVAKGLRNTAKTGKLGAGYRTAKKAGRSVNRGFQNREDLMRLATYKHGLDKGLSKAEAADLASAFHIDYGDVTQFERTGMRRVAPFYTFSARALPIHVKALVNTPGKIAAIEKARQELAYGMGIDDGWEGQTPEWKQRAVPFGVKIKGENVALDAALPVAMLNELPTGVDPKAYALEMWKFSTGLLTPAIKIPIEVGTGQSLFFRKPIKDKYTPYVSAPGWVRWLPENVRNGLGVVSITDKRSGKIVPGWDPWTNYAFRQIPGLATQFQQLTTPGALQSGRHDWQKVSGVLGVKADPIDPQTAKITTLFNMRNKLDTERTALGKTPGGAGGMSSSNPRTRALTKKLADIDYQIYKLSVERGDAVPTREGAIKNEKLLKPRVKKRGLPDKKKPKSSSGWGSGASSGSGW
jgi:hypothetical protein